MPVQPANLSTAVVAALSEFSRLKRAQFLQRYGLPRSKRVFVRGANGTLCDAVAILRAARLILSTGTGTGTEASTDGDGEEQAGAVLDDLGFEVVMSGGDWTQEEVDRTVADYFDMLGLEARGVPFVKAQHNAALRAHLRNRSKASIELKHQNISAILLKLDLPFIQGYKPRGNVQAMLRDTVGRYVEERFQSVERIVDHYQETTPPAKQLFKSALVTPPVIPASVKREKAIRVRVPRKIDFAAKDEANSALGRNAEEWVVAYEGYRLREQGLAELAASIDWIADRLGDGAGYDIKSFETAELPRYIEVKGTNGSALTPFYVTRGELEFSQEVDSEFWLYRVFGFRRRPMLFVLQGGLDRHLHLEPVDYRARLKALS